VRVFLAAAFADHGRAFGQQAIEMRQSARSVNGPAIVEAYRGRIGAIAAVLLQEFSKLFSIGLLMLLAPAAVTQAVISLRHAHAVAETKPFHAVVRGEKRPGAADAEVREFSDHW